MAAQSLVAAGSTIDAGRSVHSLHGYFMRPGDPRRPLIYQVERLRDGRSYATRRVTAVQDGEAVFTLSASFKYRETADRPFHQRMPEVPGPEQLHDSQVSWGASHGPDSFWATSARLTLDVREVPPDWPGLPADPLGAATRYLWMRSASALPSDDELLHTCALAYLSDLRLASTAALHVLDNAPGGPEAAKVMITSLDHAMWFHQAIRADEWLLLTQRSPVAGDGRGLAQGEFYTREGSLVASVVQEALVRTVNH